MHTANMSKAAAATAVALVSIVVPEAIKDKWKFAQSPAEERSQIGGAKLEMRAAKLARQRMVDERARINVRGTVGYGRSSPLSQMKFLEQSLHLIGFLI
ncbi:hypothetical protein D5086_016490 [Populus alba]|uniref:Uncharacterized protein n=1 Tax=Populus alba TaxID=43335 RepID=A0ACC4BU38_POPAL